MDILLGVDLVSLSVKQMITHAILVTGDSDFLPAIDVARNEGILVHLFHGSKTPPHRELWDRCDERTPITELFIKPLLRAKWPRQRWRVSFDTREVFWTIDESLLSYVGNDFSRRCMVGVEKDWAAIRQNPGPSH